MLLIRWFVVVVALFQALSLFAQERGSRLYWRSERRSGQNMPGGYYSQQGDRARSGSNIRENSNGVNADHRYEVESRYRVQSPNGSPLAEGRIGYQGGSRSQGGSYDEALREGRVNQGRAQFLSELASGMAKSEASVAVFEAEVRAGRIPRAEAYYLRQFIEVSRELSRTAADGAQARDTSVQSQKWERCRVLLVQMIDIFHQLDRAVGGIQPEYYNAFMDKVGKYENELRRR